MLRLWGPAKKAQNRRFSSWDVTDGVAQPGLTRWNTQLSDSCWSFLISFFRTIVPAEQQPGLRSAVHIFGKFLKYPTGYLHLTSLHWRLLCVCSLLSPPPPPPFLSLMYQSPHLFRLYPLPSPPCLPARWIEYVSYWRRMNKASHLKRTSVTPY